MSAENYISSLALLVSIFAAYFAYSANTNSNKQYLKNESAQFISKFSQNLDNCYTTLHTFFRDFADLTEENCEKRLARENILYLVGIINTEKQNIEFAETFIQHYNGLDIKISDITYENNFEKIMSDLATIRNSISILKIELSKKIEKNPT